MNGSLIKFYTSDHGLLTWHGLACCRQHQNKQNSLNWPPLLRNKHPVLFIKSILHHHDQEKWNISFVYPEKNNTTKLLRSSTKFNMIRYKHIVSIFWDCRKKSSWPYLSLRTKTHLLMKTKNMHVASSFCCVLVN